MSSDYVIPNPVMNIMDVTEMAETGGIAKEGKMAEPLGKMEWDSAVVVMREGLKSHRTCAMGDI
eukprot:8787855-Heterocapsa_arctica.AAC.1